MVTTEKINRLLEVFFSMPSTELAIEMASDEFMECKALFGFEPDPADCAKRIYAKLQLMGHYDPMKFR